MKEKKINFLLIYLFISISFSVLGQDNIILDEQFNNNNNKWDVGDYPTETATVKNGYYNLKVQDENSWHWFSRDIDLNYLESFKISTQILSINKGEFGIIWGAKDAKNLNLFIIDSENHTYSIKHLIDGKWLSIIKPTYFDSVNIIDSSNYSLEISKIQNGLFFKIY